MGLAWRDIRGGGGGWGLVTRLPSILLDALLEDGLNLNKPVHYLASSMAS